MTDATATFFEELERRGHEPLLEHVTGTMRFDLSHGKRTDHFFVSLTKGDLDISTENAEADCVVTADRALFDGFATGDKNMMTAFLRREVTLQGDPQLLVLFQRIFQGPQRSSETSVAIGQERRQS